ncbi:MAG TPA: hypothetical protein VKB19_02755 [Pedobacter sp.]|nr:hypothetical protein [Pedobacter sp.]
MDQQYLSRIDRAVADNINDLQRSFGAQAGLVQDFIVFISRRLKVDLFGYTRFTMQEFCAQTGRTRQELAVVCPDFLSGKALPPIIQGFAFQTVLDYALYCMMERNIIFSSRYEVRQKDKVIHMHNFPILKDLRLNFGRSSNEQKIYEIRVSDELINGFLSRYYTLNAESYRQVGKGRGGDGRKKLLLYLSKLSHVLQSSGLQETLVPLDRLCDFAEIDDRRPGHKKQNLIRALGYLQDKGKLQFVFEFVSRPAYQVRLVFSFPVGSRQLQVEHSFYIRLMANLRIVFDTSCKGSPALDEDPFQGWLVDPSRDLEFKAQVLAQTYYAAMNKSITSAYARSLILSGEFTRLLIEGK